MAKFTINGKFSSHRYEIDAHTFGTSGEFVDFYDEYDQIVFRMKASDIHTVERAPDSE